ncbi:MAG: DUF1152 domain-containing protein [Candidatus Odinarchaeia archaeon]
MSLEDLLTNSRKALLIGIGGGGDILGTIPTRNLLSLTGVETVLAGLTWERVVNDPKPGPRKLEEIINCTKIAETVAIANEKTRTYDGVFFQASRLSKVLNEETLLIDINKGVVGVVNGLNRAITQLNVDLVIGIDVGGDVAAEGTEKELKSPLADNMMLAALANLKVKTLIGIFAPGCDGELTLQQLSKRFSEIAENKGFVGAKGLTERDIEIMENALKHVITEASALPLKAAKGFSGRYLIRDGRRSVDLSIFSTLTFYFKTEILYQMSKIAPMLKNTSSFHEAYLKLKENNIYTEYDFELNWSKNLNNKLEKS